jgi:malic enzyme
MRRQTVAHLVVCQIFHLVTLPHLGLATTNPTAYKENVRPKKKTVMTKTSALMITVTPKLDNVFMFPTLTTVMTTIHARLVTDALIQNALPVM